MIKKIKSKQSSEKICISEGKDYCENCTTYCDYCKKRICGEYNMSKCNKM